ncbi:Ribosome-inactivating protein [Penicillium angulare]|uniref:Ribosome-inactivating protein n=1 Tax=Penicillium angulare TaxID=116970 RepID=UPI002541FC10|nr:Ribosome-inactivating protein [Penicillium angulare]KAJ5260481.1 Ribosome-inactivating protein [Penicillium angulare]
MIKFRKFSIPVRISIPLRDTKWGDPIWCKFYGTITAINGLQSDSIYNRDRKDHESIETGQNAITTGPSRNISAADDFAIDFNLKDSNAPSANEEVAQSRIAWNANDQTNYYGKLRTETINGSSGSAVVDCVVMSNASEASVDIILLT